MSDEGWEARMAERTRLRREDYESWRDAEDRAWQAREARDDQQRIAAHWTLGQEVRLRRGPALGCACTGPPSCCINRAAVGDRLLRQASVLAGLIKAVADSRGRS